MSGIALVTGASQGIGRTIACRLAKDGFRVAVNDIPSKKDQLEELQKELSEQGKECLIHFADVSVESEVEKMIADVVKHMGGLDVMVANAGICITKPLVHTTKEDFGRLFSVNVDGTFFCYKHAALHMIEQGRGGRIIGASSVVSKQGAALLSGYSASKFAVRGLTQAAAAELGTHGITVNTYAPGSVDTRMLSEIRTISQEEYGRDPNRARKARPIEEDIKPEEIAGLVSYLASKEAAKVTGQSISINGGMFYD